MGEDGPHTPNRSPDAEPQLGKPAGSGGAALRGGRPWRAEAMEGSGRVPAGGWDFDLRCPWTGAGRARLESQRDPSSNGRDSHPGRGTLGTP